MIYETLIDLLDSHSVADTKKAFAFYLPSELMRWVNMQAEIEARSRSYIVERALNRERAAVERAARGETS